ncbi:MAG TPA: outer membrane protein assembly factor BamD [Blastocatellia bacterium]|nr:outer membrane protein assembly factor BamD [Blastocatellia bacterium]
MRKTKAVSAFLALVFSLCLAGSAMAQVGSGPKSPPRDPELEKSSKTNLEAGEFYIKNRKAYKAGIDRLEEVVATYPEYSRMDLVYYWLGIAYTGLSNQAEKANKKDEAAKNRAVAVKYYKQLLKEFPEGELTADTKKALKALGEEN